MLKSTLKLALSFVAAFALLAPVQAGISQSPMLTRATTVAPNLVFVFDDSGSMDANYMYQTGPSFGGMGMAEPDSTYSPFSPDINMMYYDPRILYKLRVNADKTSMAPGSTASVAAFTVYFYTGTLPYTVATAQLASSYAIPSYAPPSSEVASGSTATYPNTAISTVANFPKFLKRTDCIASTTSCTWAEERQNYANWLAYHSTRVDLARTGIGLAFKDFGSIFRLGWGTINGLEDTTTRRRRGGSTTVLGALDAGVSQYTSAVKTNFYNWLYDDAQTGPSGDTPNRMAINNVGKYYSRTDSDGPWGTTPNANSTQTTTLTSGVVSTESTASHASCRRSNVLLITDGYWNGASSSLGNEDGSAGAAISNPNGNTYTYAPVAPYTDSESNTLSDATMKYWKTDLRPDLTNNVPTLTNLDEAFWQHMSFFGIGLGIYGTLPQTTTTLSQLTSGALSWPAPSANNPSAVDDMWHAAINSRGQFLNARNSDNLSDSIAGMMAQINKITSSQSGVALSTANLTSGTRKYIPNYQTGSWKGNVVARNLNSITGNETSTAWQVVGTATAIITSVVGATSTATITYSGIPAHGARNIVTWTGTSAEAFTNTASVTGNMNTTTMSTQLISYLRGDQSNEGGAGYLYRPREVVLGDIINSSPIFVKGDVDLKYDALPAGVAGASTYRSYYIGKAARAEGALFVGANDGMLHAFREGTGVNATNGGTEVFAYIPRAVRPNLHLLADKNYAHRYFVDGPNTETDVYFSGGSSPGWKNLLIGSTGAGAKAVYALDVSAPVAMSNSSVLWEISNSDTNYSELGHVLSDVQTGMTPSGDWVSIFGNGYDSASRSARLYVANAKTGAYITSFAVGSTPSVTETSNGLGAVRAVRDANQRIIGAYAGDLYGKMWKFDLTGASSSNWQVGNNGTPIYDTGSTTKAITASPAVVPKPGGGSVVVFATGKLFEDTDLTTTTTQSVYGVLDEVGFGTPTSTITAAAGKLVQQTISGATTATRVVTTSSLATTTKTISYYTVSRNTVTFSTTVRGWYIDYPAANSGQRNVYPLDLLAGRYVGIDSISPTNVTVSDPCAQSNTGAGWLYYVDGLTGGGPSEPILDTNGDGKIDSTDSLANGISTTADGRNTSVKDDALSSATQTTYANVSGGSADATLWSFSCTVLNNCVTNVKREWRQLFMR